MISGVAVAVCSPFSHSILIFHLSFVFALSHFSVQFQLTSSQSTIWNPLIPAGLPLSRSSPSGHHFLRVHPNKVKRNFFFISIFLFIDLICPNAREEPIAILFGIQLQFNVIPINLFGFWLFVNCWSVALLLSRDPFYLDLLLCF